MSRSAFEGWWILELWPFPYVRFLRAILARPVHNRWMPTKSSNLRVRKPGFSLYAASFAALSEDFAAFSDSSQVEQAFCQPISRSIAAHQELSGRRITSDLRVAWSVFLVSSDCGVCRRVTARNRVWLLDATAFANSDLALRGFLEIGPEVGGKPNVAGGAGADC
jgi:hypothetical protein